MNKAELKETVRALNKIVAAQTAVILQHEDKIRDLEDQMAWYSTSINHLEMLAKAQAETIDTLEAFVQRFSTHQGPTTQTYDMRKVFPWTGIHN
jgi:uncharacterized coiled-coil protein SlyX